MLIADYNYELDMKVQREEAWEDGRDTEHRIMILKIYNKGKSLAEIADMFDESVDDVKKIVMESDTDITE